MILELGAHCYLAQLANFEPGAHSWLPVSWGRSCVSRAIGPRQISYKQTGAVWAGYNLVDWQVLIQLQWAYCLPVSAWCSCGEEGGVDAMPGECVLPANEARTDTGKDWIAAG